MRLPAFCDNINCGHVFYSGISIDNSSSVTFIRNKSSPCPKCGGWGHIPDGVFNFVGNTIEILSAPNQTIDELRIFTEIIREAQKNKLSSDEVTQRIEKEAPSFSKLTSFFPTTKNEFYGF